MFAELLRQPGVEEVLELRSSFGFLAFHGGSLEAETDTIAQPSLTVVASGSTASSGGMGSAACPAIDRTATTVSPRGVAMVTDAGTAGLGVSNR